MILRHQISFINKRGDHYEPHERISHIGGINHNRGLWKLSEYDAINSISYGEFDFFVLVNGQPVTVIIAEHEGRQYLKTEADGYSPDNLLALPECP
ncbi:DUF3892 domain-containing protein [Mucilaginibacter sp. McL0603]|uniref:DUF3892 domain-containing protein n=1 Tax=Mucilaginibacter sp. McL0603 TaxID=3415670 RepID=UPI003CF60254